MSRKIFHRIDEMPRKYLKNNSKIGPRYLTNPKVWVFTECTLSPYSCDANTYKKLVKDLIQQAKEHNGLNNVLFWVYATDLIPIDIYFQMTTASAERNHYMDLFKEY